jgi:hypothetical protein
MCVCFLELLIAFVSGRYCGGESEFGAVVFSASNTRPAVLCRTIFGMKIHNEKRKERNSPIYHSYRTVFVFAAMQLAWLGRFRLHGAVSRLDTLVSRTASVRRIESRRAKYSDWLFCLKNPCFLLSRDRYVHELGHNFRLAHAASYFNERGVVTKKISKVFVFYFFKQTKRNETNSDFAVFISVRSPSMATRLRW